MKPKLKVGDEVFVKDSKLRWAYDGQNPIVMRILHIRCGDSSCKYACEHEADIEPSNIFYYVIGTSYEKSDYFYSDAELTKVSPMAKAIYGR